MTKEYDFYNHFLTETQSNELGVFTSMTLDLNLSTAIEGNSAQTIIRFGDKSHVIQHPYQEVRVWWENAKRWCQS